MVKNFIDELALNSYIRKNILLDRKGMLAKEFKIIGVPTFIFFKNGEEVYRAHTFSNKLLREVFGE
ncbi:MAG: hypothetical protein DRP68_02065 [Candidatus Omnitrophota bacterium]|nr:MAG: hypothetical protein DRP68_02065 [Candidatus Omnitrophota bacterium]